MKTFLKHIYVNLLALYLVDLIYPGFSLPHTLQNLLLASLFWLLINKIVKPILKLLLLPINLITLGLFSWIINCLTLLILQYFVTSVAITPYQFLGTSFSGFVIPPIYFNIIFSYLITAFLLNLVSQLIVWLNS